MCGTCGCGSKSQTTLTNLQTGATVPIGGDHEHVHADGTRHSHAHNHDHDKAHTHSHGLGQSHVHDHTHHVHADATHHSHSHRDDHAVARARAHAANASAHVIELEARILAKNDELAARNRAWFIGREILALNLVSSPGAGKTSLLERTIRDLAGELDLFVIEGDQATDADGARIRAAGAPAVQVNTGTGCHLEADMIARGLAELRPGPGAVLMIENVGNLVCPAMFDLGEQAKVVVLSVTEGDDKPLKYPHMFRAAEIMILNKIDLLPHVDFDVGRCIANARAVNPAIDALQLSVRSGQGMDGWYDWLRQERSALRARAFEPVAR